jgi:deferrochelatase/peroxidase EfeB
MTKRHAGWMFAMILVMGADVLAGHPGPDTGAGLTVCLTFSQQLEMDASLKAGVIAEANRIWQAMGVTVKATEEVASPCDRWILVKSSIEAAPEDAAREIAIAWVPFVEKRARRVVFVRMNHARGLIEAFGSRNGVRPPAETHARLTKLVGRSLAHELGHVLLNDLGHEKSGLMRARYGADDALRDLPSAYTLSAHQLDRVFAAR